MAAINRSAAAVALCYHNIEDSSKMKALTISTAQFESEMQALKDNGFTVIGMQDFLAWRRGEKDIPAKSAIITIDDGWISTYENAWPILKKFGYPFTVFIYINYVGSGGKSMSWDQLAEMRDGGVDIQSHTYSHSSLRAPGGGVDKKTADLVKKDVAALGVDGWMRKEVVESKRTLEKELAIKCNVFAYPFGVYSAKARDLVKEAGYEAAFTVYGQQLRFSSPPYDLLGRYAIDASKPQIFADALKMIGGGVFGTPMPASGVAQLAAASMITQPMEGETISDPNPLIKANLATMGQIDPASVEMRISGLGTVPAKYDAATKTVSYKVTEKLHDKNYSVILSAKVQGKRVETRWSFQFDPNPGAAQEPAYSLPGAQ
jgi:peptidoglycan/xylan/chitin deacetylase (PgdA/CDA1 family)